MISDLKAAVEYLQSDDAKEFARYAQVAMGRQLAGVDLTDPAKLQAMLIVLSAQVLYLASRIAKLETPPTDATTH